MHSSSDMPFSRPAEQQVAGVTSNEVRAAMANPCPVNLSDRHSEILLRVAMGESNADIGRALFITEDTVKTHLRRLLRSLGARNRTDAVTVAFLRGILVPRRTVELPEGASRTPAGGVRYPPKTVGGGYQQF